MSMLKEFKEFAVKGNVMDLAIGLIIGAAFSKIIASLIEDVITPLILNPILKDAHLNKISDLVVFGSVRYGVFLSNVIHFIVVTFVLFLVIKGMNASKKKKKKVEAVETIHVPSREEALLEEIRDLLKKG
jgi:large conductance mechanosensitive channel